MTTMITYRPSDVWLKAVKVTSDGFDYTLTVWESTPNLTLSANTSMQQISLEELLQITAAYSPKLVEEGESGISIYDGDNKERFLEITDVYMDSLWVLAQTVPYEGGHLQIKGIHPLSKCAKNIEAKKFVEEVGNIILSSATVEECGQCGDVGQLHSCGTYDDEGEAIDLYMACTACRERQGFVCLNNHTYYNMDISDKLNPGKNWRMSVKFGGILDYNFQTTSASSGMGMEDRKNYKSHKKDSRNAPYMGIEIEVSGKQGAFPAINNYAKEVYRRATKGSVAIVSDSSLGGDNRSFEIVTIPAKLNYLKECVKAIFKDDIFLDGPKKGGRYGMHVHIDRASLTTMQMAKMSTFINAKENRGFITLIAGRDDEGYCHYLDSRRKLTSNVNTQRKKQSTRGEKHVALSFATEPTLEMRIFNTPSSYEDLCTKLEFVEALVMYTKNVAGFRDLGFSSFINWLKKSNSGYSNLVKKVKDIHYTDATLPLSSIANVPDTIINTLLACMDKMELKVRNLDSNIFRQRVRLMLKATSSLDKSTRKEVLKILLGRLYSRCKQDPETFWKVVDAECAYILPPDLHFTFANKLPNAISSLRTHSQPVGDTVKGFVRQREG